MNKNTLFSDDNVSVSDKQFIANGHVFNIHDIQSITQKVIKPSRGLPAFSILIGLLFLLDEGALFVIGGFAIALGGLTLISAKTQYAIVIQTSTGEHTPLLDTNITYIEKIIQALDTAMSHRHSPQKTGMLFTSAQPKIIITQLPVLAPSAIE
jgi:hypothetical protein